MKSVIIFLCFITAGGEAVDVVSEWATKVEGSVEQQGQADRRVREACAKDETDSTGGAW